VAFSPTPSPAQRYWNMARQRHYHLLARCCRALRVSADRALLDPARTPAENPSFPCQREKVRFAADSSLEETGFEPSVPLKAPGILVASVRSSCRVSVGGGTSGGTSRSSNLDLITRYRRFESRSLQRRVGELFRSLARSIASARRCRDCCSFSPLRSSNRGRTNGFRSIRRHK
jgi:hypothetical protein